jgi:hypothetical protein
MLKVRTYLTKGFSSFASTGKIARLSKKQWHPEAVQHIIATLKRPNAMRVREKSRTSKEIS